MSPTRRERSDDPLPPNAGREAPAGGPEPAPRRAGFREEAGRFVVSNHEFGLAFSTLASGTLCDVHLRPDQANLVDAQEAVAEGFLWRVTLTGGPAGEAPSGLTISNRNCERFAFRHTANTDGSLRLQMEWTGMRVGAAPVPGTVVVQVSVPAQGCSALVTFRGEWADQVAAGVVEFPCVCALGASDPSAEESLFLPLSGGLLIPEPRGLIVPGAGTRWEARYPGEASLQIAGYTRGRDASVGLACHDSGGEPKVLTAAGMPRSNRLLLSASAQLYREEDGRWRSRCPVSIIVTPGDWFEVAREYRVWAVQQPWCGRGRGGLRELPSLTAAHGFWFSFWGGPQAVVTVARELQRIVSVPLKLDWRCWHGCARDGAYPDYLPPREGDQGFAQAKRHLAEAGVLTQIGINGLFASPASETWRQNEAEFQASAAAPSSRHRAGLVPMRPAAASWRERISALTRETAARAEGLYLEDLLSASPLACRGSSDQHATGEVAGAGASDRHPAEDGWVADVRGLLEAVRPNLGEHTHLAADAPSECYLDLVDVFFTPLAAAEREGLLPPHFGSRWAPIPLFSAVYHPYCTLVGSGISLVNNRPFDPMWTAEQIEALHEPEALMQQDFSRQFYLEATRAITWGQQLMVGNFNLRQARDERCRRKLAFMAGALVAQGWGFGKLLPFSDFSGLLEVEAEPVEVPMLVNPPRSTPEERSVTRRRVRPVLGSAWTTPGAGTGLVLANMHDQPAEFSAALRASRLGISGKLQAVGRTFTPDGEAPLATLHASATEISGRLPPRAVFLVTMRPEGMIA
jgi:hypothetical protein